MRMRMLAILLVLTGACAGGDLEPDRFSSPTVCLNPGATASVIYRAEAIASRILGPAKVRLNWAGDERRCEEAGEGIRVTLSYQTPEERSPGALATAFPYEGNRIVLFYDRVARSTTADALPAVLGHVLAHELVHLLQGVAAHSTGGLMKARWERRDYVQMQRGLLRLDDPDIRLLRRGLAYLADSRLTKSLRR
jgi:hypothetical protein